MHHEMISHRHKDGFTLRNMMASSNSAKSDFTDYLV